jgi:hypothetical protein
LLQEGLIGRSGPLLSGAINSLLAAFLSITPEDVPVPQLLLAETPSDIDLSAKLNIREISPSRVTASQLELPITIRVRMEPQSCTSTYYPWFDWHDAAVVGLAPKTYYSSDFGGRVRYAGSYIYNCTPPGSPSWLWARHRIYYYSGVFGYIKHFEGKVPPGHWQEETKGSVKRYRKVAYDDGWDSSPNCGLDCKYTREGRFHN